MYVPNAETDAETDAETTTEGTRLHLDAAFPIGSGHFSLAQGLFLMNLTLAA